MKNGLEAHGSCFLDGNQAGHHAARGGLTYEARTVHHEEFPNVASFACEVNVMSALSWISQ